MIELEHFDVAIIGGGVAGVFTAYRLSLSGLKVCVVEAHEEVDGATSRSGGIVTRMMDNPLDARLAYRSIELIKKVVGNDREIIHPGYLSIEEIDDAEEDFKKFRGLIPDLKILDSSEITGRWDYIKVYENEVGLYASTDFTIEPGKLLEKMWAVLQDKGVEMMKGKPVKKTIFRRNKEYTLKLLNGEELFSSRIVLAAGAWNKEILEENNINLNVLIFGIPIFKFTVDTEDIIGIWDEEKYSYWRPSCFSTWIGGAYDSYPIKKADEGFLKPSQIFEENIFRVFKYRFRFKKWKLTDSWSGPISISKDYKPILKEIDSYKGLYVIDGLGGRGLMRGPALGEKLAEMIVSNE